MENQRPPLPSLHSMPKATIDQWVQIPADEYVSINITRNDIDNLYFSISNLITSQDALQEALIAYSNGELEQANEKMDSSRRYAIESMNSLRGLMAALMSSALKNRGGAT